MEQTVFSCSIARHEGDVDIEVIGEIDRARPASSATSC